MTAKDFVKALAGGKTDVIQVLLSILEQTGTSYCVIGGLAVNAYTEPVVSLDLDLVVISKDIVKVAECARAKGLTVQAFEHSVNVSMGSSDLRIQLQTDSRYQAFIARAEERVVLGYTMSVAALADVLQGKVWAFSDESRRKSKRQKDLADIFRLIETHPELKRNLPAEILSITE